MPKRKTILVAPLHWGLGHATRCIPIIRTLLANDFNVLIASDGAALLLLQKEFPTLDFLELPSYNISYPENGRHLKIKMLLKLPAILKVMAKEKRIIKKLVAENMIDAIISDNRFGVRNPAIPSVYVTHQLNVLTGKTTYFSSKLHQKIIKKFDVCWVPDVDDPKMNLSGNLGHLKKANFPLKYMGILSRMAKKEVEKTIDILALLSGPEPQRTILEERLKDCFRNTERSVLIIRGMIEKEQKWTTFENLKLVNYMNGEALEDALNKSEIVISRSGYTSIMDLAVLEKKVFFIPTPGQYEQEYLAERLKNLRIAPSCKQEKFTEKKLDKISRYKGLKILPTHVNDFSGLFTFFEGK